jgi:uncharacterized membrane protein
MKILKLALGRETAIPTLALVFGSGVSVALVIARVIYTRNFSYAFLIWNLFLAWLPFLFALLARDEFRSGARPMSRWRFGAFAAAWLLFFPNAPYIFTDVIHLTNRYYSHFWVDLVLVLSSALTGLVLGFLSLFLMQSLVARLLGWLMSWLFIAGVASLSGFGIYLGRFLRINSWDVVFQPLKLYHGIGYWAGNPLASASSSAFPILFATFLFVAYVMLYGLTHLQPATFLSAETGNTPRPS